jgi:prephenate dehydrogenase
MTVNITIIGLGRIGASIGLALAAHKDQVTVTGHDKSPTIAQVAKKLGAVDKVAFNLPASVENADVVVLSLPLDQVCDTLKVIAQDLREDAVVLDTSPAKAAAAAWVKELLPAKRHYIGLTPAINPQYLEESARGVDAAHADLFQHSLVAVSAPAGTAEAALKLAADFVTLLGASPYFADLAEVDGIMACVHILPQLAATALMESALNQPGWSDIRKLAGPAFAAGTASLAAEEPSALAEAALQNQQTTVRVLGEYIAALSALREEIASGRKAGLEKRLKAVRKGREKWMAERAKDDWLAVEYGRSELPTTRNILKQQIGGLDKLFSRRAKKDEEGLDAD